MRTGARREARSRSVASTSRAPAASSTTPQSAESCQRRGLDVPAHPDPYRIPGSGAGGNNVASAGMSTNSRKVIVAAQSATAISSLGSR